MGYLRIIAIFTACFILMSTEIDCQIPDDVVVVDVRPVLLRGLPGKLKCQFSVVPQAVYWLKEHTANSVTLLVKWFRNEIDGKGFSDGLMTIDANFSLIIHTVNDDDAGRYFCRVADFRNNLVQNHTDVSVADFLSVEGCSTADCFLVSNQQDATLRCNARNVPQEVVKVYWLPNDGKISLIAYHSLFYDNGTENIEAVVKITPDVNDVFTCVAEIKSTRAELARVSVTAVPQTPTNTMTNLAPMVTATSQPNDQKGANIVPIAASVIGVIALAVVFCVVYKFFKWNRKPEVLHSKSSGPISYIELWEMCTKTNNNKDLVRALGQFLIDKKELGDDCRLVIPPKDIYNGLCRWKEKTEEGSQWKQLSTYQYNNSTLQKQMEEYRQKNGELSYDDISHVLWCVAKQTKRVKALLKHLNIKPQVDLEAGNTRALVEKCFMKLKEWADGYMEASVGTETTRYVRVEKGIKLQEMAAEGGKAFNVKVAFCLAVEKAGCQEEAKTYFQISEKNKKPLDKSDIETVALTITKRHFVSLSREIHMKPEDIDVRNRENLEWMFRTDKMLEDWVSRQECSNYEIRCRLRKAAERCDRKDVADLCIEKDQCDIYPEKDPSVSFHNEQRRPSVKEGRAGEAWDSSAADEKNVKNDSDEKLQSEKTPLMSKSKDQTIEDTETESAPIDCEDGKKKNKSYAEGENGTSALMPQNGGQTSGLNDNFESQRPVEKEDVKVASGDDVNSSTPFLLKGGDNNTEENENEDMDVTSSTEEEDVGLVSNITREEIQLIRKYADPEAVRSIAVDLKFKNPGSAKDVEIVRALKRETDDRRKGQRKRIRGVLKKINVKYERLLAERNSTITIKAEIPRLAMRLLMTDVYPFAKALGYSMHRLSQFQQDYSSAASNQGTNKFIRQQYEKVKTYPDYQTRTALPKKLILCGYGHISRTVYFDYEVSTSDLMAVATRIEPGKLAEMLGIEHYTNTQTPIGGKIQENMKMLTEWRKMMCPPDCNHRTALADIIHNAGYKHVAMEIITGQYRDCVPSKEVLTELAHHIPASEAGRLCEMLGVKMEQLDPEFDNVVLGLLVRWVKHGKENSLNPLESEREFRQKVSNKVYDAGFINLANEIMTGIRHGKVTQLTNSSNVI